MPIDYPRAGRTGPCKLVPSWRQTLSLVLVGTALLVGAFFILLARTTIPAPNEIASAQTSIVYWNDGKTVLGTFGNANRISIPLSQVPLVTQHAVLAAEDREFYSEGGFSPQGVIRAALNNVRGGSTQGASTITQQYAKNAFLTAQRTWSRKIEELLIAEKLQTQVSKDQILEDYLNTIYFGRGAYGIQTASQAYFGIPASRLDLAQSAALAAIIRSPAGYAPERHLTKLEARWNYVIAGMVTKGWITQAQSNTTKFPKFRKASSAGQLSGTNGYLLAAVRAELSTRGISDDLIAQGGLRIVSTFNKADQAAAVKAVQDEVPTTGAQGLRVGLAAVTPGTGAVVAMYGGADYAVNQVNNATQAIGQAGSTFKAFTLAAATEQGVSLDSRWNGDNGVTIDGYRVVNDGDASWGNISLLTATEQSVNSVFVAVSNQIGYQSVVNAAERAGIPANTPALSPVRSVSLGVASPHVIDMAGAYATFANGGGAVTPTVLQQVRGANDGLLLQLSPTVRQEFTPDVSSTVSYALQNVITNGTGSRAQALGRPAAGKTGTTNGNLSAWFIGYTPQLSTAVMFVRDGKDGNPVSLRGLGGGGNLTGGNYPTRVWTAFMKAALQGQPVLPFPTPVAITPSASPTPSPVITPSPSATTVTPSPSASASAPPTPTPTPSPSQPPPPVPSPSASPKDAAPAGPGP
ncbi:MAG: transglycosylase domain-containing protein [Candidatus Nanopelagicales bacterium]